MQILDDFEAMLKGIADELGFGFATSGYKGRGGYILSKPGITVGFTCFINRTGNLTILMSPNLSRSPVDLGTYTQAELKGKNSKARKAILVKLLKN